MYIYVYIHDFQFNVIEPPFLVDWKRRQDQSQLNLNPIDFWCVAVWGKYYQQKVICI